MKVKQIIFPEVNKAKIIENSYGELAPNYVAVKTMVSTISN